MNKNNQQDIIKEQFQANQRIIKAAALINQHKPGSYPSITDERLLQVFSMSSSPSKDSRKGNKARKFK